MSTEGKINPPETTASVGSLVATTEKTVPADDDKVAVSDSAASNILKYFKWSVIKATLKTYFDGLYPSGSGTSSGTNTGDQNEFKTISSDSGSTTANSTTDTLTIVGGSGIDTSISSDTLTVAIETVVVNTHTGSSKRSITVTIDNGASVIATGAKKIYATMPCAGTLTGWRLLADTSTTTVIDIWKKAYDGSTYPTVSNTITASAKPSLTTATQNASTTLTGWTIACTTGDVVEINIDSNNNAKKLIIELFYTVTGT